MILEVAMQHIIKSFNAFKLAGMACTLEERVTYANNNKLSYSELLELLCEDEKSNRYDNSYQRRKKAAKLPTIKQLEDFDFSFQPSIDKKLISDLATCKFIKAHENVLFIGGSGTGKTHLSIALALKALARDYTVYFTTVSDLLYNLHMAKADNSYHKKLKQIIDYDLLILDELGFKQLPKYSTDDFFNVISKRYETKSTIITTNKIIDQWNDIFDEQVLTRAIVDRIMHHASIISINGKSFRMKTKNQNKKEAT
jgi:DNA replication protein DnaC